MNGAIRLAVFFENRRPISTKVQITSILFFVIELIEEIQVLIKSKFNCEWKLRDFHFKTLNL